jgi:hypothetical protein
MLAVLLPLGLGACADTMTSGEPVASSTTLLRDYDKTLTKSEQKQAISDLELEQRRQQQQAGQEATASPAKPVATPN